MKRKVPQSHPKRFLVVGEWGGASAVTLAPSVILIDYNYWDKHYTELILWCTAHGNATPQGMTVSFKDEMTLTAFLLRWA